MPNFTVKYLKQPVQHHLSKLAFKQRLTQSERIAIRQAAEQSPEIYDFQDLLDSATFVDLKRDDTINGVNFLESIGIIDEGRADEILNTAPHPDEIWNG